MPIDKETGYYSMRQIMGYSDCTYYFVLSDRGRGKSYGMKHFLMAQDGKFMCVYRQSSDMNMAMKDWIEPLIESGTYTREQFEWDGNDKEGYTLMCNGSVKGYFRYITQVNHIKQEHFPNDLNYVWWDEFIPLQYKKLPGIDSEGAALRVIMKTIDHDSAHSRESKGLKPLKCILFGNPFTWDNPILSYFHINGMLGYGIHRAGPGIVWEWIEPLPEKEQGKQTVDDFLGNEVNRTVGIYRQDAFIAPLPKGSIPIMSLRLGESFYQFYKATQSRKTGHTWVIKNTEHKDIIGKFSGELMRLGSMDGLKEDERCINGTKLLDNLRSQCYRGLMMYTNINDKFDFLNDLENYR